MTVPHRPLLRWPLEVRHIEERGERFTVLVDPLGLADSPAVIPTPLMPIVARFDGRHELREIVSEGAAFGVTEELVQAIIAELTRMRFMDTAETRSAWTELKSSYRTAEQREAAFAGTVYPAGPAELRRTVSDYLQRAGSRERFSEQPVAMICPHIDYRRGWQTYASAFVALRDMERPDALFLIGTSHQPGEGLFHLTDKSFATPLGAIPVARRIVNDIAERYGRERSFADEILHRREHSLELQLPFIAHHFEDSGFPEIVPILVGSFHQYLLDGRSPQDDAQVADFIGSVAESLRELQRSGRRILFYGGIDLAHVGQHFGDPRPMSDEDLLELERRDFELLSCVLRGDEEALLSHIAADLDSRRICGFPSLYVMFAALRQAGISVRGSLIEYRQAVDRTSDCIVSFASAAWFAQ